MAYRSPAFDETFSIPSGPSKPPWKIILGVIIVTLVLGGYLVASEIYSHSREIYFVNGTDTQYSISINNKVIALPPDLPISATVPEGEVTIERIREDGNVDTFKVQINTPLLTRLFDNNTFVINPDRTAIFLWERDGYYKYPDSHQFADAYKYAFHTGEDLYHFKDIDCEFIPFPYEIQMDSQASVATRDRISIVKPDSAEEARNLIENEISHEASDAYLDNYLLADPDSYEHLNILRGKLTDQQFLDYSKPFIEKRPVLLNCHRFYIDAMRNKDIQFDLVPQYRKLLAENPEDPIRIYLLAKAHPDREESLALYRKAADDPDAPNAVHHALFLNYLSTAQFNKALSEIGILRNTDREDLHYMLHEFDTLVALQREAEALKLIKTCSSNNPSDGYIALRQMTAEFLVNGAEHTGYVSEGFRQALFAEYRNSEWFEYWDIFLSAHLLYISGNEILSAQSLNKEDNPYTNFIRNITLSNFKAMDTILDGLGEDVDYYLTAALAALQSGDQTLAKPWLNKAAELLEINSGKTSRRIASWLRSQSADDQKIDSDMICKYSTHASTKRLLLAVMMLLDPTNKTQYSALARKLNFDRRFPYLLIKQVVGE